ncbi:MAG: hypothetical protein QOG53_1668 [Frankiales bacterium]|nr:hypothetical protein [Frankiales bacterium]
MPRRLTTDIPLKRDIESRRLAIIRALRGREAVAPGSTAVTEVPDDLGVLTETVSDLATRVDQLSRDLSVLKSSTVVRHHIPEMPHVVDDDEPISRASVPPVTPAKISNHAFDVLLGRP